MWDVSNINIEGETYSLKDAEARRKVTELEESLGSLAFKDSADGKFTPHGTITAPEIDVTPTTTSIKTVSKVGTLPSWDASVEDETLSFSWSTGELPTTTNKTVVTNIASASASQPVFSGTEETVTVN